MVKIVVRQINWNGKGVDREFPCWVKPGQVELKIRDIKRAFNMDNTVIEVVRATR